MLFVRVEGSRGLHCPQKALSVSSYPGDSSSFLTFRLREAASSTPFHSTTQFPPSPLRASQTQHLPQRRKGRVCNTFAPSGRGLEQQQKTPGPRPWGLLSFATIYEFTKYLLSAYSLWDPIPGQDHHTQRYSTSPLLFIPWTRVSDTLLGAGDAGNAVVNQELPHRVTRALLREEQGL